MGDKTRIMITKRTGEKIELKIGDLFNITETKFDNHANKLLKKYFILKVVKFANNTENPPTHIYYDQQWPKIPKKKDISYFSTYRDSEYIDSIINMTGTDLHYGGRRMRLKSRKCSSKKNRRITRRR